MNSYHFDEYFAGIESRAIQESGEKSNLSSSLRYKNVPKLRLESTFAWCRGFFSSILD